MPFGQLVVGSPGAGKTVYCEGMSQILSQMDRKVAIVNLDPGNDNTPYECAFSIQELGGDLDNVMKETNLGPNGSFMFALDQLDKNFEWFEKQLDKYPDHYFIFDCPGQVELYTHHSAIKAIIERLQKKSFRLVAVQLIDSVVCTSAPTFISAMLVCLTTMLHLELPHINVLSKIDLLEDDVEFADHVLQVIAQGQNLDMVEQMMSSDDTSIRLPKQFKKLTSSIVELIEDFGLVSFHTLHVENKELMLRLLRSIDKSNGYVYGGLTVGNESIMEVAAAPLPKATQG